MATTPEWQIRQFFNMPTVNPNAALDIGVDANKSLMAMLQAEKEAEATAAYRKAQLDMQKRQQDWVEGEDDRAEKKRLEDNQRDLMATQIAKGLAFHNANANLRDPNVAKHLKNLPEFKGLSTKTPHDIGIEALVDNGVKVDPNTNYNDNPIYKTAVDTALQDQNLLFNRQNQFINNAAARNRGLDPTAHASRLKDSLMATGQFSEAEADAKVASNITSLFPTMDKDTAKTLIEALKPTAKGNNSYNIFGRGGVGSGLTRGGAPSYSLISASPGAMDADNIVETLANNMGLKKGEEWKIFGIEIDYTGPFGKEDVTRPDFQRYIAEMWQEGIPPYAAAYAVVPEMNGNNANFKPDQLSDAQKARLIKKARKVMETQERGFNRKGGTDGLSDVEGLYNLAQMQLTADQQAQEAYRQAIYDITAQTLPSRATSRDIASRFAQDELGVGLKKPTAAAKKTTDTGGQKKVDPTAPGTAGKKEAVDALFGDTFSTGLDGAKLNLDIYRDGDPINFGGQGDLILPTFDFPEVPPEDIPSPVAGGRSGRNRRSRRGKDSFESRLGRGITNVADAWVTDFMTKPAQALFQPILDATIGETDLVPPPKSTGGNMRRNAGKPQQDTLFKRAREIYERVGESRVGPAAQERLQQREKQQFIYRTFGTGPARKRFEASLTPEQRNLYEFAMDPRVSLEQARRVFTGLRQRKPISVIMQDLQASRANTSTIGIRG